MDFTTSDGAVMLENQIYEELSTTVTNLKQNGFSSILSWEKELLEWLLDKNINSYFIHLHQDITEEDLEKMINLKESVSFVI